MISADSFTETEPDSIPTGRILPVDGTPLDFRKAKPIGRDIHADWDQLTWAGGYDHNFVLTPGAKPAASVYAPKTGIVMEVLPPPPACSFIPATASMIRTGKTENPMNGSAASVWKPSFILIPSTIRSSRPVN
ncbi:MAG: hypothetical protein V8S96_02560 [Lachnospiraceae bacterium]